MSSVNLFWCIERQIHQLKRWTQMWVINVVRYNIFITKPTKNMFLSCFELLVWMKSNQIWMSNENLLFWIRKTPTDLYQLINVNRMFMWSFRSHNFIQVEWDIRLELRKVQVKQVIINMSNWNSNRN